jgi:hypothetical protein
MKFGSVSDDFANLRHVKTRTTRVSGLNALFCDTKVVKHPFYSIGPKMKFGSVSEHFANPWRVNDEKLVFRTWMHYFGVPKLWSIHSNSLDPKWCLGVFRSISLTLGTSKMKNSCFGTECTILVYQSCETSILIHWTQNEVWECFGAFR